MKKIGVLIFPLLVAQASAKSPQNCQKILQSFPGQLQIQVVENSCGFSPNFVSKAIERGLAKVCEVNFPLVQQIVSQTERGKLSVQCDLGTGAGSYPHFEESTSTIHLWTGVKDELRIKGTLFHEFLHFAQLPYDPKVHDSDQNASPDDPVYACHVTGYPEVAKKILGDVSKLPRAIQKCSTVVLKR